ncbi:MAG: EF-P lysine aminoacylase EpmA [Planctomycetota bacterium]
MPRATEHDDFRPTASWESLRLRAQLLERVRKFFGRHGFLEVETPILSADTVVDRHLDPFCVAGAEDPAGSNAPRRLWLQTSPEFAMKRLLAAGAGAIYQVTRAFRQGECGRLHNPEFTIVEWYRTGNGMTEGMALLSDLCEALLSRGPAEGISYRAAFERHVGLDPHTSETGPLRSAAERHHIAAPASLPRDDRDGWLDLLLSERVAPNLGHRQPVILYDYPAGQAALARLRPEDPPVAERFELFASGIELANGYHELLDPDELRRRNAVNSALREADGKSTLPEESRLLAAMEAGLPAATGVALGFDRVVMLAAGAKCLDEVIAFPFHRA